MRKALQFMERFLLLERTGPEAKLVVQDKISAEFSALSAFLMLGTDTAETQRTLRLRREDQS